MVSQYPEDKTATMGGVALSLPEFSAQGEGARLVCIEGPGLGASVSLTEHPITVGSADSCDLRLNDALVSRRHAEIYCNGRLIEVIDKGSKNGCYQGGDRFERKILDFGSEFSIGMSLFKVVPEETRLDPCEAETSQFGHLIGQSSDMRRLFTLVDQVAATDVSVLIEGETGVGKELVAEEIHRRSARRDRPFIVFDCGAVPSELIESALFGHQRGAFTGANTDRPGLFDEADGGTLFLDEIGELSLELQPSLLRVLDRGMVRSIGQTQFRTVDVRIIAATHRSLPALVEVQQFREDLYYRLAVVRLSVPPLRDRSEDVPLLVNHFLQRAHRPDLQLPKEQLERVANYSWPGNVRELRNLVQRGVALARHGIVELEPSVIPAPRDAQESGSITRPITKPTGDSQDRVRFRDAKAAVIEDFERTYLADLMKDFNSMTKAAKAAGMDRKHLRVLLEKHGLS